MPGPNDLARQLRELTHDNDTFTDDLARIGREAKWLEPSDDDPNQLELDFGHSEDFDGHE